MKALITGGSGYFGSLLVKRLLLNKWDCQVLDLNDFQGSSKVKLFKGDIRNFDLLLKACVDVDVVFHNVAQVPLAKNTDLFNSVNIGGTENVLKASLKSGVKKVIYTSSSAIYGIPESNPVSEKTIPKPMESYGNAKYIAEKKCNEYISDKLDIVIIRPRTILGHGRLGIFQILFEWIKQGKNIPVIGKGDNIYQFIHADDLSDAIILASDPKIDSGIYNCGAEEYGSMRESLQNLCNYSNSGSVVKSIPYFPTILGMKVLSSLGLSPLGGYHSMMYGESMYFNIDKAKRELLWKPKFSNDKMFRHSFDWYCKNRKEILSNNFKGSYHQTRVKAGVLNLFNKFL